MKLNNDNKETPKKTKEFKPLPEGYMQVAISGIEDKEAKSGTCNLLVIQLTVTDPKFKGRKLWCNLAYKHNKEIVNEISLKKLNELFESVGGTTVKEWEEVEEYLNNNTIKGEPVLALLETKETEQYGVKSEIKGFISV